MSRRRRWNPKYWKLEALARLKERGCPVCSQLLQQLPSHFFWFLNEQYYEPGVIADLCRSYGFCPTHTRYLLNTGGSSVITTVFSYLTGYALSRLHEARVLLNHGKDQQHSRDRCRQAADILRPQTICHACVAIQWCEDHNISIILQTLPDAEVQEAYESSTGLCLPHFHKAGLRAEWGSFSFLTRDVGKRLTAVKIHERSPDLLLDQIEGMDQERLLRHCPKKTGPSEALSRGKEPLLLRRGWADPKPWSPALEEVLSLLAEPGCPVCAVCEQGVHNYLNWLAREMDAVGSPSAHWDMSWQVCPSHFWELWASGHDRAAVLIAEHTLQEWLGKLKDLAVGLADRPADQLIDRIARLPAAWSHRTSSARRMIPGLWDVVVRNLESPEHRLDRVRTAPFREGLCQACYHIQETTRRTLDLILRVVEEPTGRKAYSQAWGLCLRHCIAAARIAEAPAALNELLTAQITRLQILEWELKEASRKHNWSVRYEPTGPEAGAWKRAAHQFCGSILWARR